jgi:hypothetical protein
MINLGKSTEVSDIPGYTQINGYLGTRISHQIRNPLKVTHNSKESEINETLHKRGFESDSGGSFDETYIDENLYLASQICKCIFILFEPISSPNTIREGGGVGPHSSPTDVPTNQGVLNKNKDPGANNMLQKNSPNINLITNIQPLNMYKKGKKEILSISGKSSNDKHENDVSTVSNVLMLGKSYVCMYTFIYVWAYKIL